MQRVEPAVPVFSMDRFVCPVELHIMLTHAVIIGGKGSGTFRLLADVLCFEVVKHPEANNGILPAGGVVNVASKRQFFRHKAPGAQPFVAHSGVACLIIGPSRCVVNELPLKVVGKSIENRAAGLNCPEFVQMAHGAAQLQLHAIAIGEVGVYDIRPVVTTVAEAGVAQSTVGQPVGRSTGQVHPFLGLERRFNRKAAGLQQPLSKPCYPCLGFSPAFGRGTNQLRGEPGEDGDLFCFFTDCQAQRT